MNAVRIFLFGAGTLLLIACSNAAQMDNTSPACPGLFEGGSRIALIKAADLVKERGLEDAAAIVVGGTLRHRDGTVVLDAHGSGYSPFFGLVAEREDDLERLLDRRVSVRGCYTSGDIRRPTVRGAVGMLEVESIEPAVDRLAPVAEPAGKPVTAEPSY